jgi:hypothetical protein
VRSEPGLGAARAARGERNMRLHSWKSPLSQVGLNASPICDRTSSTSLLPAATLCISLRPQTVLV